MAEHRLARLLVDGNSLVDQDVEPLEILEEADNVEAHFSESVENWRVDSFGENAGHLLVDNHVGVILHSFAAPHQELIPSHEHTQGADEPAVSEVALHTVA